jgi:3-hydroxyisobutyrate dehydrogenase-like beta-hydroxyacid dehydrogenase
MLGLGKMGAPMAKHLLARGFEVCGFDPAAKAPGVTPLGSPAEVARSSELVIVVVGFDREVEEGLFGRDGVVAGAKPGLIVAVGSTIAPKYAKHLADRLSSRSLIYVDAPLARGEAAAVAGKLLIFGGGDEAAFERCKPAFAAFATDVFHLGPAGAGQTAKMVNNLILWACTSANDEGLRLAEALGVDGEKLRAALHHSSAQNWSMDQRAELSGMPWAEKDMSIVLHEADLARLALPLSGTIKETIKALKIRLGYGLPHGAE